jgi:hypothetical protein
MNQINRSTRLPQKQDIHPLLAELDETNEDQRRLRDLIRRFHSGRWPLFRCLGMRNVNRSLVEAVEWLRTSPPRYSIIYWQSDGLGLSSAKAKGARHALWQLDQLSQGICQRC